MSLDLSAHAKFILAGEHTVLRGGAALVFPVREKKITLSYSAENTNIDRRTEDVGKHTSDEVCNTQAEEKSANLQRIFATVVETALKQLEKSHLHILDGVQISNTIPIGAGMGGSAAVCVLIVKWLRALNFLNDFSGQQEFEFARQLENIFHGDSSGVDIAGVMSKSGVHFERNGPRYELDLKWQPQWLLSYCGRNGLTLDCVNKVNKLSQANPARFLDIDVQMKSSVKLAEESLTRQSSDATSFQGLVQAIQMAESCFHEWDLIGPELKDHLKKLKSLGARAAKPTGSGDGGYVLSLWSELPKKGLPFECIQV